MVMCDVRRAGVCLVAASASAPLLPAPPQSLSAGALKKAQYRARVKERDRWLAALPQWRLAAEAAGEHAARQAALAIELHETKQQLVASKEREEEADVTLEEQHIATVAASLACKREAAARAEEEQRADAADS